MVYDLLVTGFNFRAWESVISGTAWHAEFINYCRVIFMLDFYSESFVVISHCLSRLFGKGEVWFLIRHSVC